MLNGDLHMLLDVPQVVLESTTFYNKGLSFFILWPGVTDATGHQRGEVQQHGNMTSTVSP